MGDRNAVPLYTFPSLRVVHHFLPDMPLRVSALRALGAYHNVFVLEGFMDELAQAAGADPVEFRLEHLEDPRARAVVQLAAERFDWANPQPRPGGARASASRATRTPPRIAPWPRKSPSIRTVVASASCVPLLRWTAARS